MTSFVKLCFIGFFAFLAYTLSRFPVIPLYAESLNLTPQQIGLVVGASTITGIFFKMPAGALSDIFGRKKIMLLGICFFAFTPFFYFLAKDATSLFIIRMIHGFATAIFTPVASAMISDLAQSNNRGQLLSTYSSANMIGRTLGPVCGGWLLFTGGFYFPFAASGICGLIALIFAICYPGDKPDYLITRKRSQFILGIREVISNKAILLVSLVECIQYLAIGSIECFLPIYSKNIVHLLEWQIGLLFGMQVIATMVSKPFLGILSDRFGRKPQITIGLILGGVICTLVPHLNTFFWLLILIAVFGLTVAVVTSATAAFVTDLSKKENYGSAHGVFGTIMDIGHASGPILGGIILSKLNYNSLFLIFGGFLVFSGLVFKTLISLETKNNK